MLTTKTLLIAAVLLIIALTPSVDDLLQAHQDDKPHRWFLWGWVGLAAVVGLAFGEEISGGW